MIVARIWEGSVRGCARNQDLKAIYFKNGEGQRDWYSGAHPLTDEEISRFKPPQKKGKE